MVKTYLVIYFFYIYFNLFLRIVIINVHFTGSPFQCHISSPARVVDVESLEKVSVGSSCEFFVESATTPVVEILGPARRPVGTQIIPTDETEEDQFGTTSMANQKYKIRFTPVDVGDHSIEVYLFLFYF